MADMGVNCIVDGLIAFTFYLDIQVIKGILNYGYDGDTLVCFIFHFMGSFYS